MKNPAVLVGLAVGDALGAPWEFSQTNEPTLRAWTGGYEISNVWGLDAGQWTDDTKMAKALAESLIRCKGFDPKDVANSYLQWFLSGDLRGIGITTGPALQRLARGVSWKDSARRDNDVNVGNGTAMRAGPLGMLPLGLTDLMKVARKDAVITHNAEEAKAGSFAVAYGVSLLVQGKEPYEVLGKVLTGCNDFFPSCWVTQNLALAYDCLLPDNEVRSLEIQLEDLDYLGTGGYVHETVAAAFYALCANNGEFRPTLIATIKAGGDTDTTGAVAGALAGAYVGLEGIPSDLLEGVEERDYLIQLDRELTGLKGYVERQSSTAVY
jgi:ADP-ribosyl-[dinitrogen reductase] hydrolase